MRRLNWGAIDRKSLIDLQKYDVRICAYEETRTITMENHGKSYHQLGSTIQFLDAGSAGTWLERLRSLEQAGTEHRFADNSIT